MSHHAESPLCARIAPRRRTDTVSRRARLASSIAFIGTSMVLGSCDRTEHVTPSDSSCPDHRKSADGTCCGVWERAVNDSRCVTREVGTTLDVAPDASAARVIAAVDGLGQAAIVCTTTSWLGVYQELSPGAFARVDAVAQRDARILLEPDLALGPGGEGLLAYRADGSNTDAMDRSVIYVARRDADGRWSDELGPWSSGDRAYQPQVRIGAGGDALVVWNQWYDEHFGVAYASARSVGASFAMPRSPDDVLSPAVAFSNAPRPALSTDGSLLITWYQAAAGPLMVYASERDGREGEPTRPTPAAHLSAGGAPVDSHPVANPKAALRDDGQAAIAWTQDDARGNARVYLAARDASGVWYPPRDLDDSISPRGRARGAELAFGRNGDLWIAWQHDDDEGQRVLLAHRAASGEWTARGDEAVVVSTPEHAGIEPRLVAGAGGGIVLVHLERSPDGAFRVGLRRGQSGSPVLDATTWLSSGDVDASTPTLAVGGGERDRVVVAWSQRGALRAATID